MENAKCQCCGMSEECTQAVNREMEKNGGKREEALNDHISACLRFNKVGRAYLSVIREKSTSPRDRDAQRKGSISIARSSSCILAIINETGDRRVVN
ncbi:hypothetical protein K2173_002767 [Erythroxylum novogranatense]|uniref:Uncharacterized protein n=1 Tax=Erythroxylum novogranatense TaxID=1862640 RepID=A0AAV8SPW6_9ROSI|nr:hypothetical protein K2173_002767 [Erythroxylum novogranatense]